MKKSQEAPIIIIRKKRGHGGHHGGAWKVAFADFMTAMFALFLVLWLINQSTDIKSAIAGYFQDPLGRADEFGSSIMPGDGAQSQMVRRVISPTDITAITQNRLQTAAKTIEEQFRKSPDFATLEGHIEITFTDEGLRIELIEDTEGYFFESGMPVPSVNGRKILALLGHELGLVDLPIRLEGHTDAHPFKAANGYTNWELSADRANAARRIMMDSGLKSGQIEQVRAFADTDPKFPDDPLSARNRRVTILVLLQLDNLAVEGAESE